MGAVYARVRGHARRALGRDLPAAPRHQLDRHHDPLRRARVNGVLTEIRDTPRLNPRQTHTIELVVDRLVIREGIDDRLTESLVTAVKHSAGPLIVTDIEILRLLSKMRRN